jgi:type IV pilus assembly protein PilV
MSKNAGFTLIEVLIAMLVLAVGLLGLAGLQATGLKNNQSAYNRSQATQLAYDLADRMRANVIGKTSYTAILPSSATEKQNCLNTTGCSLADMATNDLYQWNLAVTTSLPNGIGTLAVTPNPCTTNICLYTITIFWDDDHTGNNNFSFVTRFQL